MKLSKAFTDKKAFIAFVTCGDPDIGTTKELVLALDKSGADIIELGMPFSDPVAEGPVIQSANVRSLANGCTTDKIFDMAEEFKGKVLSPIIITTYTNVVFSYGIERFFKRAAKAGVSGIVIPDIPFEEKEEFSIPCKNAGIDYISIVASTSEKRIEMIAKDADGGFILCTSTLAADEEREKRYIFNMLNDIKKVSNLPVIAGLDVADVNQAVMLASMTDGVIVDCAIVELVEKYKEKSPEYVAELAKEIRKQLDEIK